MLRHATPRSLWGAATVALNTFAVSSPGGACKATAACGPTPWAYVPGIRRWWRPFTLVRICGHTARAGPLPPPSNSGTPAEIGGRGVTAGAGGAALLEGPPPKKARGRARRDAA